MNIFRINKIDDNDVIELFEDIQKHIAQRLQKYERLSPAIAVDYTLPPSDRQDAADLRPDESWIGSYAIQGYQLHLDFHGNGSARCKFSRMIKANPNAPEPSAVFDEIEWTFRNLTNDAEVKDLLTNVVKLSSQKIATPPGSLTGATEASTWASQAAAFNSNYRQMLAELDRRIKDIDVQSDARMEKDRVRREEEWAKIRAAQEELNKDREALNRDSYKSSRRDALDALAKDVERSSMVPLPLPSQAFRYLILAGVVALAVLAGHFALDGASLLAHEIEVDDRLNGALGSGILEKPVFVLLFLRTALSTTVMLASIAYVLRQLSRWHDADAAAASEHKRYAYDLRRASWLLEANQEVQKEGEAEIPQELIVGVTNGLFEREKHKPNSEVQALSALLGVSGKVSYGPDGLQGELNKKATKELGDAGKS